MKTCCFITSPVEPRRVTLFRHGLQFKRQVQVFKSTLLFLYEKGFTRFITGLSNGADTLFAEFCLAFRLQHPEILIEAALPYELHFLLRSAGERERYFELVEAMDFVNFFSMEFSQDCLTRTRAYVLSQSRCVLTDDPQFADGDGKQVIYV